MDHNSSEYRAHLHDCLSCRFPLMRSVVVNQHRPHTLGPDCWCIPTHIFNVCELDRREYKDLPEVTYI